MKRYISFYDEGHYAFVGTIREIKTLLNNLWKRNLVNIPDYYFNNKGRLIFGNTFENRIYKKLDSFALILWNYDEKPVVELKRTEAFIQENVISKNNALNELYDPQFIEEKIKKRNKKEIIKKMSFANNLKNFRKAKGLNQEQLARKININRSTLSCYENGYREPTLKILKKMSEVLEVSLDELIKGERNNED